MNYFKHKLVLGLIVLQLISLVSCSPHADASTDKKSAPPTVPVIDKAFDELQNLIIKSTELYDGTETEEFRTKLNTMFNDLCSSYFSEDRYKDLDWQGAECKDSSTYGFWYSKKWSRHKSSDPENDEKENAAEISENEDSKKEGVDPSTPNEETQINTSPNKKPEFTDYSKAETCDAEDIHAKSKKTSPLPLEQEKKQETAEEVIEEEPLQTYTPEILADRAAEFVEELRALKRKNIPEYMQRIAELFSIEHYRAEKIEPIQSDSSEPVRVLLLAFSKERLVYTLNYLANLAKEAHEGTRAKSLEAFSYVDQSIVFSQDSIWEDVISEVPLEAERREIWTEGLQFKFSFGDQELLLIFPKNLLASEKMNQSFRESTFTESSLFQTPRILAALKGLSINKLWHSLSAVEIQRGCSIQFGKAEFLWNRNANKVFEECWDARSSFFPEVHGQIIIDNSSILAIEGEPLQGFKEYRLNTVKSFKTNLKNIKTESFKFIEEVKFIHSK